MSSITQEKIKKNAEHVYQRIQSALLRAHRGNDGVRVLVVTKNVSPSVVQAAAACGFDLFGENRIQEAKEKIPLLSPSLHWHFIGHLQTNKARDAVRLCEVIHSVDSMRLIEEVHICAARIGKVQEIFLEVNVSGEDSKYGFTPYALLDVVSAMSRYSAIRITGLMTVAPLDAQPKDIRQVFAGLRHLKETINQMALPGIIVQELSMCMSNDFEIAIEEGATIVRLGHAIFE